MPLTRLAALAPSLPGMALPAQIGKYRIKSKLGEGSTSEVFLAHDPFRDRDVAIKRVRTGVLADPREQHYQQTVSYTHLDVYKRQESCRR